MSDVELEAGFDPLLVSVIRRAMNEFEPGDRKARQPTVARTVEWMVKRLRRRGMSDAGIRETFLTVRVNHKGRPNE